MSGVHHFVPVLHRGDAVGRHTLRLRQASRARGYESHIYVAMPDAETGDDTVPVAAYPSAAQPGDVLVYQFATASPMAPWLAQRTETLIVNYHNVTPPELLAPWDNHLALGQLRAQADLGLLAPRTSLAVADSAYNEAHLADAGFARTAVVPPSAALDPGVIGSRPARRQPSPGGARWLSVGRVAPNKALHDAIAALAVTRESIDPGATLSIIGKPSVASYDRALHRFVADLGLSDAVTFGGHASDATLAAAYAEADVLVVTSQHEGFCVPVVEAMTVGLPVVACGQGALPEVLGDAGVFVTTHDPVALAQAVAGVLSDGAGRARRADAAQRRLVELDLASAAERFVDLVATVAT